jgi:hypothetical protein
VPLLVSLTRKRAIYLALELDRSWTETLEVNPLDGTVFCERGWRFLANCNRHRKLARRVNTSVCTLATSDDFAVSYKGTMQFRFAQHLFAVALFACPLTTQKSPVNGPSDLQVDLGTTSASNRFKVGEPIELEAIFSSKAPSRYLEPCGLFGKPQYQTRFWVSTLPVLHAVVLHYQAGQGWTDIRGRLFASGPTFEVPNHDLSAKPTSFSYMLTDAYRFDEPGEYHVTLSHADGYYRTGRREHTAPAGR